MEFLQYRLSDTVNAK